MSSKTNSKFPAVGLPNARAGRNHIAHKAKAAWKYIYDNYFNDYDFFIKTDPDTYLVVENLLDFLSDKDPSKPYIFGHHYNSEKFDFIAGGPGEVLTKAALKLLVTEAILKPKKCWPSKGHGNRYKYA